MAGCHPWRSGRGMTGTTHSFITSDARRLNELTDNSPALIVTSPPYPMISMWDESFAEQSTAVALALKASDGQAAFNAMHEILDVVWTHCHGLLLDGGLICVNVGDAVRTLGGNFQLFANAARVTSALRRSGFSLLPQIIWRKPANSPTKFMGSGMLPGGAYVTLEHEVIVIGRKGGLRRPASQQERACRRRSAIFWEERNEWYSDLWTLPGVRQGLPSAGAGRANRPRRTIAEPELFDLDDGATPNESELVTNPIPATRERSAAFPFELAYRLIAMHSWSGDLVIDPFAGTGTTAAAAMSLRRSSVSLDRDVNLVSEAAERLARDETLETLRSRAITRLDNHRAFVRSREKAPGHTNDRYKVPVVTSQETDLEVPLVSRIHEGPSTMSIACDYESGT